MSGLCTDVLLGHDFLRLHERLEVPFHGPKPAFSLCGLLAARIEPQSLFGHISPACKPIAVKSRRYSQQDLLFIKSEIENLLRSGIIEHSQSPWRAQVLVVKNDNHNRRLVIDYSQTINRFTYLDAYPLPRIDDLIEKISRYAIYSTLDLKSAYHQVPIKENEKQCTAFEVCGNLYQFCRIPFGVTNGVACFQRAIDGIISKEQLNATFAYVDNIAVCGTTVEEHDKNLEKFLEVAKKYGITFNETKSIIRTRQLSLLGFEVRENVIKPDPERLRPLKELSPPQNKKSQERIVGMFAYYSRWISHFSDKINPLVHNRIFPLPSDVVAAFETLKRELMNAVSVTIDPNTPLVVETDASDIAIAASLNQNGRPVAFFSRTLSPVERRHSSVEKEAYAIVESLKKWRHFLIGNHFTLLTDQRSVAFMFDNQPKGKIKNEKIQRWRIELSDFHYDIVYRPGTENHVADTLSRGFCGTITQSSLKELHESLCHPGVTRMTHFVRARNLPFSIAEIKSTIARCPICAEIKPRFYKPPSVPLIKATQPLGRLSVDFKEPLPSNSRNKFLLTIIDEFSRFPFAYACPDTSTATVIKCLINLFSIFGMPSYIHTDRGSSFMSDELRTFLHSKGIAVSRTTPYNPQCNGQVERLNGSIWKAILLTIKTRNLAIQQWEEVLPDALHSLRSLLCTATNATPHERMFHHNRKATSGTSLPSWLLNSKRVFLRKPNRASKYDPLIDEVELLDCNPNYARIRFDDGREDTVSLRNLAPSGDCSDQSTTNEELKLSDNNIELHHSGDDTAQVTPLLHETEDSLVPNGMQQVGNNNQSTFLETLRRQQQRVHPYCLRNRDA